MYPVPTLRSRLCLAILILSFVLRLDILSNIKLPINIVYAYLFSFTTAMPTVQFILLHVIVLTIAAADYFTVQLSSSFISAPNVPHNNALDLTGHIQYITTVKSSHF